MKIYQRLLYRWNTTVFHQTATVKVSINCEVLTAWSTLYLLPSPFSTVCNNSISRWPRLDCTCKGVVTRAALRLYQNRTIGVLRHKKNYKAVSTPTLTAPRLYHCRLLVHRGYAHNCTLICFQTNPTAVLQLQCCHDAACNTTHLDVFSIQFYLLTLKVSQT